MMGGWFGLWVTILYLTVNRDKSRKKILLMLADGQMNMVTVKGGREYQVCVPATEVTW